MLSTLFYVASLVGTSNSNSDFVNKKELMEGVTASGGLVVKMGPVMNVRVEVEDVKVISGKAVATLPAIVDKGSLFEGFSHSRLYAVRYTR
jgi:hypothetical protein